VPGAALVLALALAHAKPAPPRGMIVAPAPHREVLVLRRAPDGTIESACVDNDAAVRAFLGGSKPKAEKK